jgi:hypothetical protein
VSDPLRIAWDALDAGGYHPHGPLHDFRARCPAHQGDNDSSLHVRAGADGNVLVWCFAHGCTPDEIVEPLSLRVRDLFPVDPGDTGRRLRTARREDFTGTTRILTNQLLAVQQLSWDWSAALWLPECPNCQFNWVQVTFSATGVPRVTCQRGCDLRMFNQALAGRLTNRRRKR